jgi:hypothetical protein
MTKTQRAVIEKVIERALKGPSFGPPQSMIRIIITDEQGTLLGQTTLGMEDIHPKTQTLRAADVGQAVLDELPSNEDALLKLLEGEQLT